MTYNAKYCGNRNGTIILGRKKQTTKRYFLLDLLLCGLLKPSCLSKNKEIIITKKERKEVMKHQTHFAF